MHNNNRIHEPGRTPEPNLFDFMPKNVWREVYRGRWRELRPVQKAEFVVEIVFFTLFSAASLTTPTSETGTG
jgi:hypothetical protein